MYLETSLQATQCPGTFEYGSGEDRNLHLSQMANSIQELSLHFLSDVLGHLQLLLSSPVSKEHLLNTMILDYTITDAWWHSTTIAIANTYFGKATFKFY